MKILFVCTGNTCRSPMAQAMAEQLFDKQLIKAASAGLMAAPGDPASANAVLAMRERNIDLTGHRSQPVTKELIEDADIILTMTEGHKAALSRQAAGKVWTLGEYADISRKHPPDTYSISDPFGGDIKVYRSCAGEIYGLLEKVRDKLYAMAKTLRINQENLMAHAKTAQILAPETGQKFKLTSWEDNLDNLHVTDHPLVESKLTMLRDENTGNKEFRELVREIATFICYEATRDVPLTAVEIKTPVCSTKARITESKFAIVPILRAGMGMVDGVSALLPTAKIGHIGMFRDPESLQPVEYYCKLPPDSAEREILLLDPMIGTGGTAVAAIDYLKENGIKNIKLLSLLGSPEGVGRLLKAHPDVRIYTAALDKCLNDHGYIVPGLGDAGDRLFGTK